MQVPFHLGKKITLLFLLSSLCGPAMAQTNDSLVVLFLSQPGVRPVQIFTDGFESGDLSRFDFNGDGTSDLVLTREDPQGNLEGVLVLGRTSQGTSLDTLWRVTAVPPELEGMNLYGFGDADADGTREAIFVSASNVVLIDPRSNTLNWALDPEQNTRPIRLIGVNDITKDGFEELFIALNGTRQVQVWTAND